MYRVRGRAKTLGGLSGWRGQLLDHPLFLERRPGLRACGSDDT